MRKDEGKYSYHYEKVTALVRAVDKWSVAREGIAHADGVAGKTQTLCLEAAD